MRLICLPPTTFVPLPFPWESGSSGSDGCHHTASCSHALVQPCEITGRNDGGQGRGEVGNDGGPGREEAGSAGRANAHFAHQIEGRSFLPYDKLIPKKYNSSGMVNRSNLT